MKNVILLIAFVGFNITMNAQQNRIELDPQGSASGDIKGIKVTETGNNTTKIHLFKHFTNDSEDVDELVINANGDVGIGVSDPKQRLQIFNPNAFNTNMSDGSQDHISLSSNHVSNGGYFGGITWKTGDRRRASIVATREKDDSDFVGIAFFTKGTDGPGPIHESMRITRNGNVGIGTLSPNPWKLAVNGKIRAKEIKVDTGWSDFVFENDYELPTLIQVENYIKNKGHLKDIPSAKEVAKNGIFLGEMDAKLLQKIEELTLYTIHQEKEIKKLRSQNAVIKKNVLEIEKLKSIIEKTLPSKK